VVAVLFYLKISSEEFQIGDDAWRWSEQWLSHAAWFLIALSAMVDTNSKGDY
jgi:hypothetical protein